LSRRQAARRRAADADGNHPSTMTVEIGRKRPSAPAMRWIGDSQGADNGDPDGVAAYYRHAGDRFAA
ncbi:MAG: hypothetical protein WBF07_24640, partial [Xanthobacteraceae bacterium]